LSSWRRIAVSTQPEPGRNEGAAADLAHAHIDKVDLRGFVNPRFLLFMGSLRRDIEEAPHVLAMIYSHEI
jgi:hypothetical protein